jgi:hypothetical protein
MSMKPARKPTAKAAKLKAEATQEKPGKATQKNRKSTILDLPLDSDDDEKPTVVDIVLLE